MSKDTGGTAFPTVEYKQPGGIGTSIMTIAGGMTLRDYFAAKAMQAAVAGQATSGETTLYAVVSGFAYDMADAMLEARK